jgi:diguanylate cyclase (GGDEF)-like protein
VITWPGRATACCDAADVASLRARATGHPDHRVRPDRPIHVIKPGRSPAESLVVTPAGRTSASEREEWFDATIDAVGDGYAVLRAIRVDDAIVDWVVVDANELVRERWRPLHEDIVGVPLSVLDAAADNHGLTASYETALRTRTRVVTEVELVVLGGLGGWRRIVVVPLDDDTVSVVTRDITRERYFQAAAHDEHRRVATIASSGRAPELESDVTRIAAVALFAFAAIASFVNSFIVSDPQVDRIALRVTAAVTLVCAAAVWHLPWARHGRGVAAGVALAAIALLGGSDQFHHFASAPSALAIYPVFFIVIITWSGFTLGRGAASIAAVVCTPVLLVMFTDVGRGSIGWQCAVVSLPTAAALGEVIAWSSGRTAELMRIDALRRVQDHLTGLANRAQFMDEADRALERARRDGTVPAILFVDLDRFKLVNDTFGHESGDRVLVETAQRITDATRGGDIVARLSGDEFAVLCERVSAREAAEVAARVIAAIEVPISCDGREANVGASVGIALSVDGTETADVLLQRADIAMYRAKSTGRGRFEIFDTELRNWVAARAEQESALRAALGSDELRVHYQPVVDTRTGRIESFEALVRWQRPGHGLVPPSDFIPIAEECGLIVDIGGWVLREACCAAAAWNEGLVGEPVGVAVNVSGRQLRNAAVLDQVRAALDGSGLDPRLLTLELTESSLIDDATSAQSVLATLRSWGARIAVDDFGTGYSSLTYLRTYPIDVIKIDRSFVDTVGVERSDSAIVAAVVALARNLGLDVVAEGVERHEQLATLIYLNCRYVQGYLFSRPVPGAEVGGLLDDQPLGRAEIARAATSGTAAGSSSHAGPPANAAANHAPLT